MTRRDYGSHTEADAAHFERAVTDYDPRDDQPSPSDLRADAEDDLFRARARARSGDTRPTLAEAVAELQAVVARCAS